ncbi:hypothetical protein PPS11_39193 [Pseudomonas putida S11]|nr:hypothetical protein PPS11_39193 [Pseudomonas putida S11]
MIDLELNVGSVPLAREISDIQRKQMPFALILAQTRLATKRIKPGITEVMAKRLDRPTPTTMRSLFAQAATKSRGAKSLVQGSMDHGHTRRHLPAASGAGRGPTA